MAKKLENYFQSLLKKAGITINGKEDYDIQVHNPKLYARIMSEGTLGFGEAYMDGWWSVKKLDVFLTKVLDADLDAELKPSLNILWHYFFARIKNLQTKDRSKEVGLKHYDLGNDLYKTMLDKRMVYTCAYWNKAKTLDNAQEAKLDLVCKKLGLKKGMKVLDIGCGWGSFAKYASEKYGVKVVGITISKEQAKFARKLCKGLNVEIKVMDYRDVKGKFDAIVSLGMFEHVGYKNYNTYFKKANSLLKDDGLFLLQTIGTNVSTTNTDPWIEKYIFPNSMLPSAKQITSSFEGLFILQDWHNFGRDYDKTLMAWYNNFKKGWPKLKKKYGERFYKMWEFYLLSSAASFRNTSRSQIQLWQILLSKKGLKENKRFC